MGHALSRRVHRNSASQSRDDSRMMLYQAIKAGDVEAVKRIVESKHPDCHHLPPINCLINQVRFHQQTMPLHIAALHGKLDVLDLLLELGADANSRNEGDGQTPLMSACKGASFVCVESLLQHGADALAFESMKGQTCLHIACRQGHYDCVVKILEAARSGPISTTWGFSRFVNVRDHSGAIPLHMAARAGHAEIVRLLLNHGAMVMAVTCNSTYGPGHGSTPLHFAARSGSVDCVEELLAWGADRTCKDLMGYTPYLVAMKHGNLASAGILNPSAREPMVWPSPFKFMQDLEPETRSILQAALAQANHLRNTDTLQTAVPASAKEKASKLLTVMCMGNLKRTTKLYEDQSEDDSHQPSSPNLESIGSARITCCICFDSFYKMIQVDECGHQMCAACTMALCCVNRPKPHASSPSLSPYSPPPPSCPFCRRDIGRLTLAKTPSIKKLHQHPHAEATVGFDPSYEQDQLSMSNCCNKRCDSLRRSRPSSLRRQEAAF